eukprot:4506691-Ditylum_brightwellii.AAC.1
MHRAICTHMGSWHPMLARQLKLWEGQEHGLWYNSSVKRFCGQIDESCCRWSPWERLLKVSQALRYSEKSTLGGRLPRALQQYGALYVANAHMTTSSPFTLWP